MTLDIDLFYEKADLLARLERELTDSYFEYSPNEGYAMRLTLPCNTRWDVRRFGGGQMAGDVEYNLCLERGDLSDLTSLLVLTEMYPDDIVTIPLFTLGTEEAFVADREAEIEETTQDAQAAQRVVDAKDTVEELAKTWREKFPYQLWVRFLMQAHTNVRFREYVVLNDPQWKILEIVLRPRPLMVSQERHSTRRFPENPFSTRVPPRTIQRITRDH